MNADEAKKLIESYLTGKTAAYSQLDDALNVAKNDSRLADALRNMVDVPDDWTSLCRVFREHADEYCDLDESARDKRFPKLSDHVAGCAVCSALLRALTPGIVIEWSDVQRWTVGRTGLAPVMRERVAKAASAQDTLDSAEWVIVDAESGLDVRLRMRASDTGIAFTLAARDTDRAENREMAIRSEMREFPAAEFEVELRRSSDNRCLFVGPLEDVLGQWLDLSPGHWQIQIHTRTEPLRVWSIPVYIDRPDP